MSFKKTDEKKGISLPGMIDIIFLLLIFSLVTLSVSQAEIETKHKGNQGQKVDLPEIRTPATVEVNNVFHNLLFQIMLSDPDDVTSPKVVYVLYPDLDDSLTIQEARSRAIKDSTFAQFPINCATLTEKVFDNLQASRLISESIKAYKEINFFEPDPFHAIEIRAAKQTEFRIINHIMNQCSMYGDTIPRLIVHTLSGKENPYGIQEI